MSRKTEIAKRRKNVYKILTSFPALSSSEILKAVKEKGYNCKITTIKNDISELGFFYDKEQKKYVSSHLDSSDDSILQKKLTQKKPKILSTSNNMLQTICLKMKTDEEIEDIRSTILEKFGTDIWASYVQENLLFLIINGANRCKRVKNELLRLKKEGTDI